MVNGTIPICADVGNVRALIGEEERGYLIRELTAPGIASAMRRAVTSSSSTRARMRAEMAEFVKKYSWNSLREVYLARIFDAN
jgi:glycosyltransferase involved in cell wall biosynthesis